jgi:uncharacterized membrane protein YfcA
VEFVVLILLGGVVGWITGAFGLGGGFIITPFLSLLIGLSYTEAVAISLAQMIIAASSGAIKHFKQHNLRSRLVLLPLLGLTPGIFCGLKLLDFLKTLGNISIVGRQVPVMQIFLDVLFVALLLWIGHQMIRGEHKAPSALWGKLREASIPPTIHLEPGGAAVSLPAFVGVTFIVGVSGGLLGIGGGVLLIPYLSMALNVPMRYAVGSTLVAIVLNNLTGLFLTQKIFSLNWQWVLVLAAGSVVGAQIGAAVVNKHSSEKLRRYFGYLVLILAVLLIVGRIIKYSL